MPNQLDQSLLIKLTYIISLILFITLSSCSQNCYEIIEVKEIKYDRTKINTNDQVSSEHIISEKMIAFEDDNLYHIFNDEYSLSQNYFGVEITERATQRRFVKRDSEKFEEQKKHKDNPFLGEVKPTGEKKTIGQFDCVEYIREDDTNTVLTYYITEDYPFIYKYQHPLDFPGFVVSLQRYSGPDEIIETIYDLKEVECSEYFIKMINELKSTN